MFWDLSVLAIGHVANLLIGVLGFAYLARVLSTESYGLLEYSIGLAGLAAIVIEGTTGPLSAMAVAQRPGRASELAANVPLARLLLSFVIVPLMALWGLFTSSDHGAAMLISLLAISLFTVPFKQDWLLQGLDMMRRVAPAPAIKSAAFAVGVVIAVHNSADMVTIGLVEIAAASLAALYYLAVQRAIGIPFGVNLQVAQAWSLIREGASLGGVNVLWAAMQWAPLFLATHLAGGSETAWLGGPQRLVFALVTFSNVYFFNLSPLIARGLSNDRAQFDRLMGSSFRLVAWGSIGVALILALSGSVLVVLAFGDRFIEAAPVFAIYIWLLPLRLLSGHARFTLVAAGRQHALLMVETLGGAVLLAAGLILTPWYGAIGAATAVILGNVVVWFTAHVVVERLVGPLPGIQQVLLPMGAALMGAGATCLVRANPLLGAGVALAVYAVFISLTARGLFSDAVRLAYAKRGGTG
jgi:O-antigen/teichoic acid export membrane protein